MSETQQTSTAPKTNTLESLLHLNKRALEAQKPADLRFTIVNETMHLVPYRQAAFFELGINDKPKLAAASGLADVSENSPYTVWINDFASTFKGITTPTKLDVSEAKAEHQESWLEWLPAHLLITPLFNQKKALLGYILYARETAWSDAEIGQLSYMNEQYSYCLNALTKAERGVRHTFSKLLSSKGLLYSSLLLIALMLIPARLSVLAPSEVIALNAFTVASPQEGVIESFVVKPNTAVKKGDLLFTLDNTNISNRYEVAAKALATAKADALSAQQRAFDDIDSRSTLAGAMGRVQEKQAELAAVQSLRSRVEVRAEQDGIAIFSDANDWIGRPVKTGERVVQIANPKEAGLLVWLPVHDAINLEVGAEMKLFLNTQPLDPIKANLTETSYQASMSPSNVSSYRIKGTFNTDHALPRIGLRGTTRISGEWSILGYYLFRRPIAVLREWSGL